MTLGALGEQRVRPWGKETILVSSFFQDVWGLTMRSWVKIDEEYKNIFFIHILF